jgi:hypothetical protein
MCSRCLEAVLDATTLFGKINKIIKTQLINIKKNKKEEKCLFGVCPMLTLLV